MFPNFKQFINNKIQIPNKSLNVGIFEESTDSIQQKKIFIEQPQPQNNQQVDSSDNAVTGKGQIYVPSTKDYYIGEDY